MKQNNWLTPWKLEQVLKELRGYVSKNLKSVCFLGEGRICFCLAKGRIPSRKALRNLENMDLKYDKELNVVYLEVAQTEELLTHPEKSIREQAKRYHELEQKCQVTDLP